ncbi:hypothetical protein OA183_00325 [Flavobacteriales bacterium]|nr:hypothetical protein [Flavobacteriales bacterium]
MENITQGHWIFAAIFAFSFVCYLIWSYRKEIKLHKIHYRGSSLFILSVIVIAFVIYVFRGYMK